MRFLFVSNVFNAVLMKIRVQYMSRIELSDIIVLTLLLHYMSCCLLIL